MQFDEDGNPIKKEERDAFANDDSTVIIPENETAQVPDALFEENGNGNGKRGRGKKRKRR